MAFYHFFPGKLEKSNLVFVKEWLPAYTANDLLHFHLSNNFSASAVNPFEDNQNLNSQQEVFKNKIYRAQTAPVVGL